MRRDGVAGQSGGMKRVFLCLVLGLSGAAAEPVSVIRDGKEIVVRGGDRVVLRYQAEPGEFPREGIDPLYRRGGYIRSILSPSGREVTDDFPPDHTHHHGVWTPWTKTEFEGRQPDFWNMGAGKGRVEFVEVEEIESGGEIGRFRVRHRFIDMLAKPEKVALEERWEVRVRVEDGRHVIDLDLEQWCAGDSPLKLPKHHYGGFGFRGNRAWNGADGCRFLSASGETDRNQVNGSQEPWCWVGGTVDGRTTGVAILCHPTNFRAPQPIRAHPEEPFFCYAPPQAGAMSIEPGKPYRARYRVIVFDGEPERATIAGWAAAYSK